MTNSLHPIQQRLLSLLTDNADDPLTVRALKEKLKVSSTSVIAHHITQLEKRGYIKRNPSNPRDFQVINGSPENRITYLNLYGFAHCGPESSILDGNPLDRIPIASRLISFPISEAFMVKAKGKSMEPKIHDGDYVIAKRTKTFEDGKVYVCVNLDSVHIKQVRLDKSNPSIVILESFNSRLFRPIITNTNDFWVEGEVKGLISNNISI